MRSSHSKRVVEVVPYDPGWKEAFEAEKKALQRVFGVEILEIHHIGSTAVPGMSAKPTIDILAVVRDIEKIDTYNPAMLAIGYAPMGEYGIKGRRYFPKGGDTRTHHVHVFQKGSPEIGRHLAFRDFMISHPAKAREYADLKKRLATKYRDDIDSYCDGKNAFIKDIDAQAEVWIKAKRRKS